MVLCRWNMVTKVDDELKRQVPDAGDCFAAFAITTQRAGRAGSPCFVVGAERRSNLDQSSGRRPEIASLRSQ